MNIRRSYRRFRYENQYDSPLLIFILDALISVAKIALVAIVGIAAWSVFKSVGSTYASTSYSGIVMGFVKALLLMVMAAVAWILFKFFSYRKATQKDLLDDNADEIATVASESAESNTVAVESNAIESPNKAASNSTAPRKTLLRPSKEETPVT